MAVNTSGMSEKGAAFIADLEALCRARGVQLSVSDDDSLELWPLNECDEPVYVPGVTDRLE